MRRSIALLLALMALSGCGDGDGDSGGAGTQPPAEDPVATVPAPGEPMAVRCDIEGLDAPGLVNLAADGVDCAEAESVLLNWLQGCGGQEGECEPVSGYTCVQERFAGSRSDVECTSGPKAVRFAFG